MALAIEETIRNNTLNDIRDKIDAGTGPGVLKIFSGVRPGDGGAETTLLGTCTFSDPSASNAASGLLTFNSITEDSSADTDGTATWARAEDSDSNWVMDMDVGESGSGASIILNTTSIVAGGPIRIDSAEVSMLNP